MLRILVVDDDKTLSDVLRYNLVKAGYEVDVTGDGESGLEMARRNSPDLILLDVMLPKLDGFEVCREIRKESDVPILMLTARNEETDLVIGLELGADDYVPKPFSLRELLARVKALIRRADARRPAGSPFADERPIRTGRLQIDTVRHEVSLNADAVHLKPKEFDLLAFLMRNPGRAFTREQLLEHVWGYDYEGGARTVDVHVRWLREKLEEDSSNPKLIETVRGVGYRFVTAASA